MEDLRLVAKLPGNRHRHATTMALALPPPPLGSPAEMAAEGWVNYCRYFQSLEADITRTSQIAREDRFSKADRAKLKAAEPESCFDAVTRSLARQRTIAQPTPQGALVIEDGCGTRRVVGEAHLRAVRTFLATAARSANKRVADEEELLHLEAELENEITQTLPPGLATSRAASPTTDMQEWFGWGLGEEPSPIVSFDGLPLESAWAVHEAGLDCPDGAATQQGPATDRDATPVSLRTEGVAAAEDGDGAAVESVPAEESGVKEGYSTSSTIEPEPAEAVGGGGADRCPAKRRARAAHHAAPDNKHALRSPVTLPIHIGEPKRSLGAGDAQPTAQLALRGPGSGGGARGAPESERSAVAAGWDGAAASGAAGALRVFGVAFGRLGVPGGGLDDADGAAQGQREGGVHLLVQRDGHQVPLPPRGAANLASESASPARPPPLTPRAAPFAQVAQHFGLDVPAQPPAFSSSHGRKRRAPVASFAPPRQQQLARETRHEAGCDSASECGSASATASTADAADCQLSDVEPSSPRKRRPSVGC